MTRERRWYTRPWRPLADTPRSSAHRPLSASLVKHGDLSFGILLSVTPHDAVDSTAWMWMAMDYEPTTEMVEFQDRIFAQDRPILE